MPLKFADKSAYLKKTEDSKEKIANIKPRILNDERYQKKEKLISVSIKPWFFFRRTVIIVSDAEDGLNSEGNKKKSYFVTIKLRFLFQNKRFSQ